MKKVIGVINYGSGNISSIREILELINVEYIIVDNPEQLKNVGKIILPGVSAFDTTISLLEEKQFIQSIKDLVTNNNIPIMGICVGMQVLFENSEEGNSSGLGLIKGQVKKIKAKKLPHMGWNSINSKSGILLENINNNTGFYFLHSFECIPDKNEETISIKSEFEQNRINAIVIKDSIVGIQFHPEKSHKNGIELFKNFCLKFPT